MKLRLTNTMFHSFCALWKAFKNGETRDWRKFVHFPKFARKSLINIWLGIRDGWSWTITTTNTSKVISLNPVGGSTIGERDKIYDTHSSHCGTIHSVWSPTLVRRIRRYQCHKPDLTHCYHLETLLWSIQSSNSHTKHPLSHYQIQ